MSGLSQLYPNIRQQFATAGFSWPAANPTLLLMAESYVPDFTNVHLADIDPSQIIATSNPITGLTATNGYCSGDNVDFGVIEDARVAASIIFFDNTGDSTTSQLICYLDTPDLPGLPTSLVGFDYFLYQNVSYGGWFRL
jgi:hypothetical protein